MGNMAAIPFMCPGDVVDAMLRGQPHQRVIGRMKADFVDPAAMQVECGKFGREAVGLHPHVENLFRPHSFAQRSQRGLYPAAAVALRSLPQSIVREVEIISGKWTRLVRHLMGEKMSRGREYGHGERSEEHTSELQSLMRISYAVFCLKKKK